MQPSRSVIEGYRQCGHYLERIFAQVVPPRLFGCFDFPEKPIRSESKLAPVIELEFADVRLPGAGQNVQPHAAGSHWLECVDLLVADRLGLGDGFPSVLGVFPYLDGIFLDVLAVVEPLHGERVVEGDGMIERHF